MRGRILARHRAAMAKFGVGVRGMSLRDIVGTGPEELLSHVAATFSPGMSWDNMEDWDLDHEVPVYAFDLAVPSERMAAFHFTNLVPVWKSDWHSFEELVQQFSDVS